MEIDELAKKIDAAIENKNRTELENYLKILKDRQIQTLICEELVSIYYFEANVHAAIRELKSVDPNYLHSLKQPEYRNEILALRKAISQPDFENIDQNRYCQIKTNLGNCLYAVGRIIEAIEQWNEVLRRVPRFAMALVNRGSALIFYADHLYEKNCKQFFYWFACKDIENALSKKAIWDREFSPEEFLPYRQMLEKIKHFGENNYINEGDSLGNSKVEIEYRSWCLKERLFLNFSNDLIDWLVAATDCLQLPDHTYKLFDNLDPFYVRFYNLLKQEFVGARMLYFESLNMKKHFADKKVLLFDLSDSFLYGLKYEKLKLSFRAIYSIFDKIALFLNEYFNLRKEVNRITFRKVWYEGQNKKLISKFSNTKNWFLKGLWWISQDILEADLQFEEVASPDAKTLANIRNFSEHRFLSISGDINRHEKKGEFLQGEFLLSIEETDFYNKTLRLMKLARTALIHLPLIIYEEEKNKNDYSKPTFSIQAPPNQQKKISRRILSR